MWGEQEVFYSEEKSEVLLLENKHMKSLQRRQSVDSTVCNVIFRLWNLPNNSGIQQKGINLPNKLTI